MSGSNMAIWEAVQKTDPGYTKHVNQRGGFTSVSANYQIMKATEQFGPIGVGWGYDAGEPIFHGTFVMIPVTLWHGTRENKFGPAYGCCEISGKRPDSDAPKKAGTDAITKLLSQLGFSADIFLGFYDDNKYVDELRREKAEAEAAKTPRDPEAVGKKMVAAVNGAADARALTLILGDANFAADFKWLFDNHKTVAQRVDTFVIGKKRELGMMPDEEDGKYT